MTAGPRHLHSVATVVPIYRHSPYRDDLSNVGPGNDRNESVRKYMARLKGMCTHDTSMSVSYTDRCLHTTMVKGLFDTDTKREILSKVDMTTLEQTVAFVEARER